MSKRRMGAVLVALLMCGLVSQSSAQDAECGLFSQSSEQDAEPKFNSNGDDITRIRGLLDEFRQDIIRKDGYALTKLVLNPNVYFITPTPRKRLITLANITLSSMGLARASSMDLRHSSLRRRTN